jgi:hypothetical protein
MHETKFQGQWRNFLKAIVIVETGYKRKEGRKEGCTQYVLYAINMLLAVLEWNIK